MKVKRKDKVQYQLFLLPAVVLFTVFVMIPLVMCFVYSFTNYTVGKPLEFVGMKNYISALKDDLVMDSIGFTLLFAAVGGEAVGWLSSPFWAKIGIFIVALWIDLGWCATLFYAYIQSIDESLYEVALMEGANTFQKAWYVTIPLIWPSVMINLTLLLSQGLKVYELPQALTNGGPMRTTYTITHAILVRGITEWEFGIASATGVIIFLMTAILCVIQLRLGEKKEG